MDAAVEEESGETSGPAYRQYLDNLGAVEVPAMDLASWVILLEVEVAAMDLASSVVSMEQMLGCHA